MNDNKLSPELFKSLSNLNQGLLGGEIDQRSYDEIFEKSFNFIANLEPKIIKKSVDGKNLSCIIWQEKELCDSIEKSIHRLNGKIPVRVMVNRKGKPYFRVVLKNITDIDKELQYSYNKDLKPQLKSVLENGDYTKSEIDDMLDRESRGYVNEGMNSLIQDSEDKDLLKIWIDKATDKQIFEELFLHNEDMQKTLQGIYDDFVEDENVGKIYCFLYKDVVNSSYNIYIGKEVINNNLYGHAYIISPEGVIIDEDDKYNPSDKTKGYDILDWLGQNKQKHD